MTGALHPSDRVDVRLRVPGDGRTIRHWTPVHVFHGAAHTRGRVALLERRAIEPGKGGLAQLVLEEPIVAAHGDVCILRNQAADQTLAGATILDVFAPRRGRARPARLAQLTLMDCDDVRGYVDAWLSEDSRTLRVAELRRNWNLDLAELTSIIEDLPVETINVDGHRVLIHRPRFDALQSQLMSRLVDWHRQQPQSAGLRMHELCHRVDGAWDRAVAGAAVHVLVSRGTMTQHGPYLRQPGFTPRLSDAHAVVWNKVAAALRAAGARPPVVGELAATLGVGQPALKSALKAAGRIGLVVRVSDTRYFLPDTLDAMAGLMRNMAAEDDQGLIATAAFRDRSGLGRNLSIEVLEHFDEVRLTARIGNARRLLDPRPG